MTTFYTIILYYVYTLFIIFNFSKFEEFVLKIEYLILYLDCTCNLTAKCNKFTYFNNFFYSCPNEHGQRAKCHHCYQCTCEI